MSKLVAPDNVIGVDQDSIPIDPSFVATVLKPYMETTTYLKSAEILSHKKTAVSKDNSENLLVAKGEFTIPNSCYIDDTGHFNAVEFNICFNQLSYVMFAYAFKNRLMHSMFQQWDDTGLSFETFMNNQLSSMLIVKIEGKFMNAIDSDQFWGELILREVTPRSKVTFFYTDIFFYDKNGGRSKGSVVLAYNPNFNHE
ncbi:FcoT family thioesterase [Aquimarina hainanensis]|uniref:(2E)-enoyl-[ACP] glycyltransferase n=1 Tax=Aquimarina hainanensis TaxID=1578017 RepID=A0ABW5NEX4_9FLAO